MSIDPLTPREQQVTDLLIAGRSVLDAARELGMTYHTARSHVRHIASKIANPHNLPALRLIRSDAEHDRRPQP